MKKRTLLWIIIAAVIILLAYRSCHKSNVPVHPNVVVSVAPVIQQDVTVDATAIGNVQAYSTVNVRSRVDGTLISVGFTEGEMVHNKQLLYSIDPRPFQIALEQAQANLAHDKAALETAQLAQHRNQPLLQKGYVAKQDYDTLVNNVGGLVGTLQADQAAIDNAKLQLSFSTIYSPVDGITGNLFVKPGNLVKAADTTPLVVINQVTPIYIVFNMPEDKLTNVRKEYELKPIDAFISANKDSDNYTIPGKLTFIDNSVDPSTGTIQLKITIPNTDLKLWPGQFVKVKVPIYRLTKALLVPTDAVQAGPNGSYLYVVDNTSHAQMRPVQLGPEINGNTVIASGVQPGMQVVTAGSLLVTDGAPVEIAAGTTK